jgi:hypothetical protein
VLQKEFGRPGYYGPYPSLETVLACKAFQRGARRQLITLSGFFAGARGHGDEFVLWRDDPTRYRNTHYNRV